MTSEPTQMDAFGSNFSFKTRSIYMVSTKLIKANKVMMFSLQRTYRWQFTRLLSLDHGIGERCILLALHGNLNAKVHLGLLESIGRTENGRGASCHHIGDRDGSRRRSSRGGVSHRGAMDGQGLHLDGSRMVQ